ncbi:MAG: hypothetical protein LBN26_00235 [Christensenellaceae bacterium]|jgi:CO/xanthine dehydrogenase Mo-binding subunit|nr:hypothetical protein [Christensenellaceae bacterium]
MTFKNKDMIYFNMIGCSIGGICERRDCMGIGRAIPRLDALKKVTGMARYMKDLLPRKLIFGYLCRCTGYENILNAIERASESGNG